MNANILTILAGGNGQVTIVPPHDPAGELEVYSAGETIALVGGAKVQAPASGFVVRWLCSDGAPVGRDDPIVMFSPV